MLTIEHHSLTLSMYSVKPEAVPLVLMWLSYTRQVKKFLNINLLSRFKFYKYNFLFKYRNYRSESKSQIINQEKTVFP